MGNVLIVVYLLIVLAMIAVILLQRSEGGALGMGGGNGGMAGSRSQANLLTRITAVLAVLYFATAIGLTLLNQVDSGTQSILDSAASTDGGEATNVLDALNSLQGDDSGLAIPQTSTEDAVTTGAERVDTINNGLAVPGAETPEANETTGN